MCIDINMRSTGDKSSRISIKERGHRIGKTEKKGSYHHLEEQEYGDKGKDENILKQLMMMAPDDGGGDDDDPRGE